MVPELLKKEPATQFPSENECAGVVIIIVVIAFIILTNLSDSGLDLSIHRNIVNNATKEINSTRPVGQYGFSLAFAKMVLWIDQDPEPTSFCLLNFQTGTVR